MPLQNDYLGRPIPQGGFSNPFAADQRMDFLAQRGLDQPPAPINFSELPQAPGAQQENPYAEDQDYLRQIMEAGQPQRQDPPSPLNVDASPEDILRMYGEQMSPPSPLQTQDLPAGPQSLESQILSKYGEAIGQQQEGIDQLKTYRDQLPEGAQGVDLSPLLSLADAWANKPSNLARGYTKPQTAEERAAKKIGVQQLINASQGNLTKSELDLLKAQYGRSVKSEEKKIKMMDKYGIRFVEQYNKDAVTKKYAQTEEEATRLTTLAGLHNAIADGSLPTFMARAAGEVGNLSEADKRPFGGTRALTESISQWTQIKSAGDLTPHNRKLIIQLANTMHKHAIKVQDKRARYLSKQYGTAHSSFSPEDVMGMVRPGTSFDLPQEGGAPSGSLTSDEALELQELEKKYGK